MCEYLIVPFILLAVQLLVMSIGGKIKCLIHKILSDYLER